MPLLRPFTCMPYLSGKQMCMYNLQGALYRLRLWMYTYLILLFSLSTFKICTPYRTSRALSNFACAQYQISNTNPRALLHDATQRYIRPQIPGKLAIGKIPTGKHFTTSLQPTTARALRAFHCLFSGSRTTWKTRTWPFLATGRCVIHAGRLWPCWGNAVRCGMGSSGSHRDERYTIPLFRELWG